MAENNMSVENPIPSPNVNLKPVADQSTDYPVNLNGHRNKKPENGNNSYGANADLPLESKNAIVSPEEFELYENLLIENLGFTREEAGNYCERYAHTYYNGTRNDRKNIRNAIRGAFDAFLVPDTEGEDLTEA